MDVLVPYVIFRGQNMHVHETEAATRPRSRNARIFKDRLTLDSFTEDEVLQNFRLSKFAIQQLYDEIKDNIDSKTKRSNAIPGITKLLAVLHYFASGSFQYCIAGKLGFTQPTFSRILRQVVEAIQNISKQYVCFPYNESERAKLKEQFYNKFGMPLTVGLIDCTHIAILPPSQDEQSYRNRKMFHSINVQVICGPNGEILDVVARYPGGTHDAFILNSSGIGNLFKRGFFNEDVLLGDNGYGLSTWLLTPYLNPRNEAQQKFNVAHRRTRSLIERVFGQLKSRFRCLDVTGGAMLYKPILVGKIILACAVLHNLALLHQIPVEIASDLREPLDCANVADAESNQPGNRKRDEIARNFYGN